MARVIDCILFDLDGTLADCRHRLSHVTAYPKDWNKFFAGIPDDTPHKGIVELLRAVSMRGDELSPRAAVPVLCSGRPEEYREVTEDWLEEHVDYAPFPLYMRPSGDQRQDAIVKLELLGRIRADGFNPILAIDDRPQVIEAWRSAGIPVLAVLADDGEPDYWHWDGHRIKPYDIQPTHWQDLPDGPEGE